MSDLNQLHLGLDKEHPVLNVIPHDGQATYHGPVFSHSEADAHLQSMIDVIPWQHDEIMMFGKKIITARQVAWFGDPHLNYTYSGKTRTSIPWTDQLLTIKDHIEKLTGVIYNSCLLNLYANGEQGMGWHSDDEKELGPKPNIASVSFGAIRRFDFRHKQTKEKISVTLDHGSLLMMCGLTQTHWQHQIPKTKKVTSPRINLTFRTINP